MKILVIGDFHGKFPVKLKRLAKGVDLIVSVGDYFPFSYRKLFFKYSYGTDKELWEVVGKRRVKEFILKDLRNGEMILKSLNKIGVPVISVVGNIDYTHLHDTFDERHGRQSKSWAWHDQDFFSKIVKKYKNIRRFDYKSLKIGGLTFVGAYGHTFPGRVKSKAYKKHRSILDRLFGKFRKDDVIFVSHNMPYDCRLDKIRDKDADAQVRGQHYGSKLIRRIIDKHQPVLAIGGHMHENQGKVKIGKTLVVNPGAAYDGQAAIIDFDVEKGRIKKVEFVK
jgi:Icc-related predicted phosphoesterase